VVIGISWLATACGGGPDLADPVIELPLAPQAEAMNLTLEEAGLIAGGELVTIYGIESDPVPVNVKSSTIEVDGQRLWQLDITVDVTVEGERTEDRWRMWVGTPTVGPPAVVHAQQYD